MTKKQSPKNKAWEKERRDRLNKSFDQLATLLPDYDPASAFSKIEIIQKSITLIRDLEIKIKNLLDADKCDDVATSLIDDLKENVTILRRQNGQLVDLLQTAKIKIPTSATAKISVNGVQDAHFKSIGRPPKYSNLLSAANADKLQEEEKEKITNASDENKIKSIKPKMTEKCDNLKNTPDEIGIGQSRNKNTEKNIIDETGSKTINVNGDNKISTADNVIDCQKLSAVTTENICKNLLNEVEVSRSIAKKCLSTEVKSTIKLHAAAATDSLITCPVVSTSTNSKTDVIHGKSIAVPIVSQDCKAISSETSTATTSIVNTPIVATGFILSSHVSKIAQLTNLTPAIPPILLVNNTNAIPIKNSPPATKNGKVCIPPTNRKIIIVEKFKRNRVKKTNGEKKKNAKSKKNTNKNGNGDKKDEKSNKDIEEETGNKTTELCKAETISTDIYADDTIIDLEKRKEEKSLIKSTQIDDKSMNNNIKKTNVVNNLKTESNMEEGKVEANEPIIVDNLTIVKSNPTSLNERDTMVSNSNRIYKHKIEMNCDEMLIVKKPRNLDSKPIVTDGIEKMEVEVIVPSVASLISAINSTKHSENSDNENKTQAKVGQVIENFPSSENTEKASKLVAPIAAELLKESSSKKLSDSDKLLPSDKATALITTEQPDNHNSEQNTDYTSDYFYNSHNPVQDNTNQESLSPTAAFLLSFPVVSTASGRVGDNGEILDTFTSFLIGNQTISDNNKTPISSDDNNTYKLQDISSSKCTSKSIMNVDKFTFESFPPTFGNKTIFPPAPLPAPSNTTVPSASLLQPNADALVDKEPFTFVLTPPTVTTTNTTNVNLKLKPIIKLDPPPVKWQSKTSTAVETLPIISSDKSIDGKTSSNQIESNETSSSNLLADSKVPSGTEKPILGKNSEIKSIGVSKSTTSSKFLTTYPLTSNEITQSANFSTPSSFSFSLSTTSKTITDAKTAPIVGNDVNKSSTNLQSNNNFHSFLQPLTIPSGSASTAVDAAAYNPFSFDNPPQLAAYSHNHAEIKETTTFTFSLTKTTTSATVLCTTNVAPCNTTPSASKNPISSTTVSATNETKNPSKKLSTSKSSSINSISIKQSIRSSSTADTVTLSSSNSSSYLPEIPSTSHHVMLPVASTTSSFQYGSHSILPTSVAQLDRQSSITCTSTTSVSSFPMYSNFPTYSHPITPAVVIPNASSIPSVFSQIPTSKTCTSVSFPSITDANYFQSNLNKPAQSIATSATLMPATKAITISSPIVPIAQSTSTLISSISITDSNSFGTSSTNQTHTSFNPFSPVVPIGGGLVDILGPPPVSMATRHEIKSITNLPEVISFVPDLRSLNHSDSSKIFEPNNFNPLISSTTLKSNVACYESSNSVASTQASHLDAFKQPSFLADFTNTSRLPIHNAPASSSLPMNKNLEPTGSSTVSSKTWLVTSSPVTSQNNNFVSVTTPFGGTNSATNFAPYQSIPKTISSVGIQPAIFPNNPLNSSNEFLPYASSNHFISTTSSNPIINKDQIPNHNNLSTSSLASSAVASNSLFYSSQTGSYQLNVKNISDDAKSNINSNQNANLPNKKTTTTTPPKASGTKSNQSGGKKPTRHVNWMTSSAYDSPPKSGTSRTTELSHYKPIDFNNSASHHSGSSSYVAQYPYGVRPYTSGTTGHHPNFTANVPFVGAMNNPNFVPFTSASHQTPYIETTTTSTIPMNHYSGSDVSGHPTNSSISPNHSKSHVINSFTVPPASAFPSTSFPPTTTTTVATFSAPGSSNSFSSSVVPSFPNYQLQPVSSIAPPTALTNTTPSSYSVANFYTGMHPPAPFPKSDGQSVSQLHDDTFTWSPNKMMIDTANYMSTTLPNLHGDLALNNIPASSGVPTYTNNSCQSKMFPKAEDKKGNQLANNFFSVSQLVDPATKPVSSLRIVTSKKSSKDSRKNKSQFQADPIGGNTNNYFQDGPDNQLFVQQKQPTYSNTYSAESLISSPSKKDNKSTRHLYGNTSFNMLYPNQGGTGDYHPNLYAESYNECGSNFNLHNYNFPPNMQNIQPNPTYPDPSDTFYNNDIYAKNSHSNIHHHQQYPSAQNQSVAQNIRPFNESVNSVGTNETNLRIGSICPDPYSTTTTNTLSAMPLITENRDHNTNYHHVQRRHHDTAHPYHPPPKLSTTASTMPSAPFAYSNSFKASNLGYPPAMPSQHHQQHHNVVPDDNIQSSNNSASAIMNNPLPVSSSSITNFNVSSICPEINDKVRQTTRWMN